MYAGIGSPLTVSRVVDVRGREGALARVDHVGRTSVSSLVITLLQLPTYASAGVRA